MTITKDVIAEAVRMCRDLVRRDSRGRYPISIESIARRLGVRQIKARPMQTAGLLIEQDGEIQIYCRAQDPWVRQRFTVAHELGHVLLAVANGSDVRCFHRGRTPFDGEERAANLLAAEMLIPEYAMDRLLARHAQDGRFPSWRFLTELSRAFRVSISTIIFRILELTSVLAILLRIEIEGTSRIPTGAVKYDRSAGGGLSMTTPTNDEARRLVAESKRSTRHTIPLVTILGRIDMDADGIQRRIRNRNMDGIEYWVSGWIMRSR